MTWVDYLKGWGLIVIAIILVIFAVRLEDIIGYDLASMIGTVIIIIAIIIGLIGFYFTKVVSYLRPG